jgi:hypothetical protein
MPTPGRGTGSGVRNTPAVEAATRPPVVPNAQPECYFYRTGAFLYRAAFTCSSENARAVVWLADGRGACGAHHQDLARHKTIQL